MVKVKYLVASLFSSYLLAIDIWKYLKIQDGRQNIEILIYVFKMAHIDLKNNLSVPFKI